MLLLFPLDITKMKAFQSQPQTSVLQTGCQQFVSKQPHLDESQRGRQELTVKNQSVTMSDVTPFTVRLLAELFTPVIRLILLLQRIGNK